MSRSARSLPRSLSSLLCVLALLLVAVPPVKGDVGRNGGIVILPCATHVSQWGKTIRETYTFQAGLNVCLRLASGLGEVAVVADCGNGGMPFGSVANSILSVRSIDLTELGQSGVRQFHLRVLNADLLGYDLLFTLQSNGDVTVDVL